jgi:hypothetical protein
MGDEFIREHIEELLRTIRMQVLRRYIRPYQRISLAAIATALNDISIHEVESLITNLILDGKLDGLINRTTNTLIKRIEYGGGGGGDSSTGNSGNPVTGVAISNANVTSTNTGPINSNNNRFGPTSSSTTSSSNLFVKSATMMKCEAIEQMIQMLDNISRQNTRSTMNP